MISSRFRDSDGNSISFIDSTMVYNELLKRYSLFVDFKIPQIFLTRRKVSFNSLVIYLLFLLFANGEATVFSNSFQSCIDQCVDRNLAVPLNSGALRWRVAAFNECDYNCHIEAVGFDYTDSYGLFF